MDIEKLVNRDLLPALNIPDEIGQLLRGNPIAAREQFNAFMQGLPPSEIVVSERVIDSPDGDVTIVLYEPPHTNQRSAVLWAHGGGYLVGSARQNALCLAIAEYVGCTVVAVEYRLAPEHPFPAGMEDCYTALRWLFENADTVNVDATRIAIGGDSAGGGVAAGLALMNRDRHALPIVLQLLLYPMISDTHDTPSGHAVTHPKVWNRDISLFAWDLYLKDQGNNVSPYAAAYRATDVSNLPPTYICVGMLDLFRDENIEYAQRLMAANVPTELVVYPAMIHGGDVLVPDAPISQRMRSHYMNALKQALQRQE